LLVVSQVGLEVVSALQALVRVRVRVRGRGRVRGRVTG
jgi:hypothetical protein